MEDFDVLLCSDEEEWSTRMKRDGLDLARRLRERRLRLGFAYLNDMMNRKGRSVEIIAPTWWMETASAWSPASNTAR